MKIGILGTGMVGRLLAVRLQEMGHHVLMGTRDVAATLAVSAKDNYGNLPFSQWQTTYPAISLVTFDAAARESEVLFNCTSGQGSIKALQLAGAANLAGKVLVDLANPLDFSQGMPAILNPVNTDSLGEQIQREFPTLRVVKSLNTMNANLMIHPEKVPGDHTVFMSGNDHNAKSVVRGILESFGWKPSNILDLGDITTARGTEMLLPVWLRLWKVLGTADFNFQIQRAR